VPPRAPSATPHRWVGVLPLSGFMVSLVGLASSSTRSECIFYPQEAVVTKPGPSAPASALSPTWRRRSVASGGTPS
jgi:hypothetical protein